MNANNRRFISICTVAGALVGGVTGGVLAAVWALTSASALDPKIPDGTAIPIGNGRDRLKIKCAHCADTVPTNIVTVFAEAAGAGAALGAVGGYALGARLVG